MFGGARSWVSVGLCTVRSTLGLLVDAGIGRHMKVDSAFARACGASPAASTSDTEEEPLEESAANLERPVLTPQGFYGS